MIRKNENVKLFVLIFIAFLFSVLARLYWPLTNYSVEDYVFNNELILTTNDAFFFAEGVRDLVNNPEFVNERSPINSPISVISAFVYKILPFSLETILVYTPVFFSSLLVVPLILLGKKLNSLSLGFISALIASITVSYYNRTMAGYFDTDFLNVVFPILLVWSLYSAIEKKVNKYLVFTAVEIILYRGWYPQSYAIEFAFLTIVIAITIFEFYKTTEYKYNLILISIMILSMMNIESIYRVIIVSIVFYLLFKQKEFFYRYLKYILYLSIFLFIIFGGLNPIIGKLELYLLRGIQVTQEGLGLHFFAVSNAISELKPISFETMGIRSSGNFIVFLLSLVGYVLLLNKYRILILTIPVLGLGFLSLFAGLRFTMYAVPICALGIGYLIVIVSKYLSDKFDGNFKEIIKNYSLIVLTILVLLPNLNHIKNFKAHTTIDSQSAQNLINLKDIATPFDYTISWWSYGYIVRYYSQTDTLIDGGKHSGSDNFPTSYILSANSQEKANIMSQLAVQYDLKRKKLQKIEDYEPSKLTDIEQMITDNRFSDSNLFLEELEQIKPELFDEEIYLFLPAKMLVSFNTIMKFSNLDLMTGKTKEDFIYYYSKRHENKENQIVLDGKNIIDLIENRVNIADKYYDIRNIYTIKHNKNTLEKNIEQKNENGTVNIFYLEKFKIYLVVDEKLMNSLFVQLFIFENYDERYFEPIELTPMSKIYKVVK